jgi:hypothetical protein
MRSNLADLPRRAWALFRRGGTGSASDRTVSCEEEQTDFELLDEHGDHLGTIQTAPASPSFGTGAPTYLLTRIHRRAHDLCSRLRDRGSIDKRKPTRSEDHTR